MGSFFNRIQRRDTAILMVFNSSIKCKVLDLFMPCITYFGSGIFSVLFCIASIINGDRFIRQLGIETSLALIVSGFIARMIKITVNRIRPYIVLQNLNIRKIGIDDYSFPSGHTTAAFCIAVMIALTIPHLSVIAISIAIAVGISRMYLGVHFPSDVLVGMLLGSITSLSVFLLI